MRSHGLTDFPDPTIGSNGLPRWTISNLDPQSSQYQTAQKACKADLPDLGAQTPAAKAIAVAKALKYVTCMRSHGEPNFPDPNSQGVIQITNASGALAQDSPQYLEAAQACRSLDNGVGETMSSAVSPASGPGHLP